jgi:TonB-linked SusC/RagA family outer membrane protein
MKRTVLILFLLTIVHVLYAQNVVTVKGIVRDGTNQPIPGVSILEKGTKNGVVSANDGSYQIKVQANATIAFSFIGTKAVEEKVDGRTTIDVKLVDAGTSLTEVVVTGYGQTVKRKDLTGAVSSLSGDEIAKSPVQDVATALQGRLAGVQVTLSDGTPGSTPSIVIRGGTSITQSNAPLYVVDGVPQTDGLSFLDPMDIESVDVLKDASATAIYGARGANGVILVTTKQIKGGQVRVNYDGYFGVKKITRELDVLNPYQYTLLQYETSATDATKLPAFTKIYGSYDSLQIRYGNRPGVDWQQQVFGQTALSQYNKISVNGGGKETTFNVFYSRGYDQGIMLQSGSTKNIGKLTVNHKIGTKFSVNAIVNYSNQKVTGLSTQTGGNARLSMLQVLLQYRPVTGLNPNDDDLLSQLVDVLDPNQSSPAYQSPVVTINTEPRENIIQSLNANTSISYALTDHLTYRGLINYTTGGNVYKQFNDATSIVAIRSGGGTGSITVNNANQFNYNNTLTYNNVFKQNHKLDVTVGQEYIYNYSDALIASGSGFPAENFGWNGLQLSTIPSIPSSSAQDDKLISFFGRANYSYKGKYLLTTSLRADGSSKFGSDNLWGLFPSAAVAWRIVEEKFMQNITLISDLKLRASYGESGNNRIPNYAALGVLTTGTYPLNNQLVPTAYQNSLANPTLKWETVQSRNLGLDLGLFKQRIMLTTEYYDNRSKDLLYNTRIPSSSGFTNQLQNIGTTQSKGWEFTLNTVNVQNKGFTWNTNFNIAFTRTKVLSLSQGETSLLVPSYTTTNDYILQTGRPVGIMYGYIQNGLYQVNDFNYNPTTNVYTLKPGVVTDAGGGTVQPGFIKFKDISGPNGVPDGVINDYDRTAIGNANPKFTGGINNTFSYKGFDLSVFLNFTYGNDIYNANLLNNSRLDGNYANTLSYFANRWTTINAAGQRITSPVELAAINQGKTVPSYNGAIGQRLYDKMIEDGSFLRINNVSLGYTLPKSLISKLKIANARIYVTGYNLYVVDRYSGFDPEVSVINTPLTPGVDFSAYPRARSFVAGVNVSL